MLTTGSGAGISLEADARPVLGTTVNLIVDLIPASSPIAGVIFGTQILNPGIPLGGIVGVPCDLYTSLDQLATGLLPGATFTAPLPIPVNPAISGATIGCQGFTLLDPNNPNALGANMSNGVQLTLGN